MPRSFVLLIIAILFLNIAIIAQPAVKQPDGGGNYTAMISIKEEITPQQRAGIIQMLQQNEQQLRSEGKLPENLAPMATLFSWPLKQAPGYNDNGYYGISNYVDENPAFPNQVLDYNCGNRTYDQSSGYNHAGTDIFSWPFGWQKMANNAVQVIAAAPGTIIGKSDNNFDQNCAFCTGACDWNAVYVMQADGSVAWYGHLKLGSLTSKAVGQTVSAGEFLGIMGSSGNSTGPHLHFEVYTNSSYTQLVDPWAGSCNLLNGMTTWWQNQEPYYVSTLNKVMTHSTAPATGQCPNQEAPNEKINFISSQTLYLGTYYRDQQNGQAVSHAVYRPDNTLYSSWNQVFNIYYSASYWYYTLPLPAAAPAGTWRYVVTYNGKSVTAWFAVNSANLQVCPSNNHVLNANISGTTFQWQVNTGTGFTNLSNNSYYAGVTSAQLQLKNIPSSFYNYQYRCFVNGSTYSSELTLKFTSYWLGTKSTAWEDPANWSCGNIPDANTDVIVNAGSTFYPVVSANATCRSTTVIPAASLTVKTGYELIITGQ